VPTIFTTDKAVTIVAMPRWHGWGVSLGLHVLLVSMLLVFWPAHQPPVPDPFTWNVSLTQPSRPVPSITSVHQGSSYGRNFARHRRIDIRTWKRIDANEWVEDALKYVWENERMEQQEPLVVNGAAEAPAGWGSRIPGSTVAKEESECIRRYSHRYVVRS
jgi:hypothetical protein